MSLHGQKKPGGTIVRAPGMSFFEQKQKKKAAKKALKTAQKNAEKMLEEFQKSAMEYYQSIKTKEAATRKKIKEAAEAAEKVALDAISNMDVEAEIGAPGTNVAIANVTVPITNDLGEPIIVRGSYYKPEDVQKTPGGRYGDENTFKVNNDYPVGPGQILPVTAKLGSTILILGQANGDVKTVLHISPKIANNGDIHGTEYVGTTRGLQKTRMVLSKRKRSKSPNIKTKTKRKKRGGRRKKRTRRY